MYWIYDVLYVTFNDGADQVKSELWAQRHPSISLLLILGALNLDTASSVVLGLT
jgi:hypothetical protein